MLLLSIEDLLLATLEYLREYRTYAHIAASYGIAESNIYRGIKWVEDMLIRDGTFSLPGRKAPLKSDMEYEVVLIDATESPIERPKKAKAVLFRKEKATYTKDTAARQPTDRGEHCAGILQRKEARFPAIQGFLYPCQGRNGVGGGYRIPGACSDTFVSICFPRLAAHSVSGWCRPRRCRQHRPGRKRPGRTGRSSRDWRPPPSPPAPEGWPGGG